MNRMIFVNLPVSDVARARAFHESLGHPAVEAFCSEDTACIRFGDHAFAMLLEHPKFKEFSPVPIADTLTTAGALYALSCESRSEVDDLVVRAVAAGGSTYKEPMDMGLMYGHGFRDLDGHIWELMWMDPAAIPPGAMPSEVGA